jgi:putative tryptophan/tyrosine transport system substrate-binding protein
LRLNCRRHLALITLLVSSLLAGCMSATSGTDRPAVVTSPRRIGFLGSSAAAAWHDAFYESLSTLGYIEGRDIIVETRYAGRQPGRLDELAVELIELPVEAIVTSDFEATAAVLRHTSVVPVVMANSGSPLPSGVTAALARPRSNLTGIGASPPDLGIKRLEIAMAVLPGLRRIGILHNSRNASRGADRNFLVAAMRDLGLEPHELPYRGAEDFEPSLAAARAAGDDVVLVMGDQLIGSAHGALLRLAEAYQVKLLFERVDLVDYGALIAYGPSFRESYARSAVYVDRILKGADPAELPLEEPPAAQLGINLRTAQALEVAIPLTVVLQAERVVD